MPADAWLLLLTSVGLGLAVELVYMRARRREGEEGRAGQNGGEHNREDGHP